VLTGSEAAFGIVEKAELGMNAGFRAKLFMPRKQGPAFA
jgi:hypothetical protein